MKDLINRRRFFSLATRACAAFALLVSLGQADAFAEVSDNEKAWDQLPEAEKKTLEERFERYKAMSPEQKAELETGLEKYKALTPDQQVQVNRAYARWQGFSEQQKAEIREKFLKWKELNPDQQQAVREQVKKALAAPAK